MTALLMGKQQRQGQAGVVPDQTAGGGGGKQIMILQHTFVSGAELNDQFLLFIMSEKCNIHIYTPLS
jgi:hypothetical protein